MTPSQNCIDLVKASEGFSSSPYICPAGKTTIGYGSTYYEDGRKVNLKDPPINEERATSLLSTVLNDFWASISKLYITRELTQNQLDAVTSFVYNVGSTKFKSSTLLKKLNGGDMAGAAYEFMKWVNGGGRQLPGLVKRRKAEMELFLKD